MYSLAIDLGTTYTAAAVLEDSGDAKTVTLGRRAHQVPSAVYLEPDGTFLFGELAEQRGRTDPTRLTRASEIKRRIGVDKKIVVGRTGFSAAELTAKQLRWIVDLCTERYGGPPSRVALTYPASWTDRQIEVFRSAAELAQVPRALLVPEPVAAATHYASQRRVPPEAKFCIYDLGGGTFDVCVVSKDSGIFRILGEARGITDLGGVDFDEAVRELVEAGLGELPSDPADPALYKLREDCVKAKEDLSDVMATSIDAFLGGDHRSVRLTRAELEELISDDIELTVDKTAEALKSAGVEASQLTSIVLVGGSSRIPLVTERLIKRFHCDVTKDTDPKYDVALGAALFAAQDAEPTKDPHLPPSTSHRRDRRRKMIIAAAAATTVAVLAGIALIISMSESSTNAASGSVTSASNAPTAGSSGSTSAATSAVPSRGTTPSSGSTASSTILESTAARMSSLTAVPPPTLDAATIDWMRTVCAVTRDSAIEARKIAPGTPFIGVGAVRTAYIDVYNTKASIARTAAADLRSRMPVVLAGGRVDPVTSVQGLDRIANVLAAGAQSLSDLVPVTLQDYDSTAAKINSQVDSIGLPVDLKQLTLEEIAYLSNLPGCESLR